MCSGPKAQKTKITNFALLVVVPMGAPTRDVEVPASLDDFSSMQTHAMGKVNMDANKLLTTP